MRVPFYIIQIREKILSMLFTQVSLIMREELITLADIELYKAKSSGRNCISINDRTM